MRHTLIAVGLLLGLAGPAAAQVSVAIGMPNVRIGINLPVYPQLVRVPGHPVYYAPSVPSNYFFYDGLYWVYEDDNWYASDWYNGPWGFVDPGRVPLYVLRVPVRYYRSPPGHFRGWTASAPPRWGDHWGNDWQHRHRGWDRWDRASVPAPAPLPVYQRRYPESRYPHFEEQRELRSQNYRHLPRETLPRQLPPPHEMPRGGPPHPYRDHGRDQGRGRDKDHDHGRGRDKDHDRGDRDDDRRKGPGR